MQTLASSLPNFRSIVAAGKRQAAFFKFLKPLVNNTNKQIINTRNKIIRLFKASTLSSTQQTWLTSVARNYDISHWRFKNHSDRTVLLRRVDLVPESLVLAQAANESAWGTSRFARQGNNLFGQWCYTAGCGIVPRQRPAGRTYEVKRFSSVSDSIEAYFHNLNTNPAYHNFRVLRAKMRKNHQKLTGIALTQGLANYSQEGEVYVRKIQWMIRRYVL